jgi:serine/threonine protein kinase
MPIDIRTLPEDQISAVHDLLGKTLKTGWRVTEKVKAKPGSSGGAFSVCYLAEKEGKIGFLKALNVLTFLNDEDIDLPKAMAETLNTFNFEKEILEKCGNKNLSKVSKLLDAGSENITGYIINNVNYLIFEKADDDVRNYINFSNNIDLAWKLRSLHNIAVGIKQLHSIDISHQDLKPSNVFIFNEELSKIGDLGRALCDTISGPHSNRNFAGDSRYAPPEVYHRFVLPDWNDKVFAIDCYLLGSMAAFYITGQSMTALLGKQINPNISILTLPFEEALPYWIEGFDNVMQNLEIDLVDFEDKDLFITNVRMLCYPDPRNRGHFKNIKGNGNSFNMIRFVEAFNLMARKAELKVK